MKPATHPLSLAIIAAIASSAMAQPALAQETEASSTTTLERIEVTGSRIKRSDLETSSPVFVIDRQAISDSGAATIGEFLQRTPAISGAGMNPQVNNGGGAGAATVDLRGLGQTRSLVLVDGKRWIPSVSNAAGAVDINTLPMAMIERVEILKDGASAIYGSDAIGGVVNFIMRRNFEGVEASARIAPVDGSAATVRSVDTYSVVDPCAELAYDDTFAAAPQLQITSVACPRFVEFVEAGITTGPELLATAEEHAASATEQSSAVAG